MSHSVVWECDRCGGETRVLAEVTELETRQQEQAGAKIGKRQRDLCRACGEDLELFMAGAAVDAATPHRGMRGEDRRPGAPAGTC